MYYRICPHCRSYLDPGERCDCKEKAASGGANTGSGKGNQSKNNISNIGGKVNARNQHYRQLP